MQQAMNNAGKQADQWNGKAKDVAKDTIDRGISELKSFSDTDIKAVAADLTHKVRDVSTDLYNDSVSLVKKYPVRAAMGLAAFTFLVGAFAARSRK